MTDPIHQQLLGHLLGALDDEEQFNLEARLERDERLRMELGRWRQRLAPLEAIRPDFEPPPGLTARTCGYVASVAPSFFIDTSTVSTESPKMTPQPLPPDGVGGTNWIDVAFVSLVLLVCIALVPPAIYVSRFQSRIANCRDALHRFGLAMVQYGYHENIKLNRLATNGQLTLAGTQAVDSLKKHYLTNENRNCFSDVWLSIQNLYNRNRDLCMPYLVSWAGWRNMTTADPGSLEVPLLADLPADMEPSGSENEPQLTSFCHEGYGRNLFFADGHVAFVSNNKTNTATENLVRFTNTATIKTMPVLYIGKR